MSVKPARLCRLLEERSAGGLVSVTDREEVIAGNSPAERMDALIQTILRQRSDNNSAIQLLDCLRMTSFRLPQNLSITHTIIWVVPTAEFAACVVHSVQTSSVLKEPVQPYFWPVQCSSSLVEATPQGYLFRLSNVFTSIRTNLVLVFPESPREEDVRRAVQGARLKWGSEIGSSQSNVLYVFSDVITSSQSISPVLYRTASCTDHLVGSLRDIERDGRAPWVTAGFDGLRGELSLYHQMLWLTKLLVEEERTWRGEESQWLHDIGWPRRSPPSLTDSKERVLRRRLKDWEGNRLCNYLKTSYLWSCDPNSLVGFVPSSQLKDYVIHHPDLSFDPPLIRDSPFQLQDTNECTLQSKWFLDEIPRGAPSLITTGSVRTDIATPTLIKLASFNCCQLTTQCIISYLQQQQ